MYELLIFDVDGLLLDTERVWYETWNHVAERRQIPELQNIFLQMIGSNRQTETILLNNLLKDTELVKDIFDEVGRLGLNRIENDLQVKDGVIEILEYANQNNLKIGVATSTNKKNTLIRLNKVDIIHYFDYIICGDEVTHMKPHPEIYDTVISKFDIDKTKSIILEDSSIGVEAAHRSGVDCIMVEDLVVPTEVEIDRTVLVCKNLYEALDYIKKENRK